MCWRRELSRRSKVAIYEPTSARRLSCSDGLAPRREDRAHGLDLSPSFGLMIVRDLCFRCGWCATLADDPEGGVVAVVDFAAAESRDAVPVVESS